MLGGRIQFAFDYPLTSAQHVRAGKLRALMVTSPKRVDLLPDVPTAAEVGFPDLEIVTWAGYFVAAATPKPIIARLNAAFVQALSDSQLRTKLKASGFAASPTSPDTLAAFFTEERAKWERRARLTGIRAAE